ncbi:MAG TPA: MAPEG family protein [Rhizomicrobium sp.]|jgi:glutathione S-transferase|nr:MAPEG family protein [Rhizomicrobium sp.]
MTLSAPATLLTAAVTLLAVLIALWTAILVSRTRSRVKIPPPAVSGSPELECALRVQANTVEQFILFMPALWVAALYFQGWAPPIIGLIWCVGRILFALGYKAIKPQARAPGFALTILSTLALVILGGIGIVEAWMTVSAT